MNPAQQANLEALQQLRDIQPPVEPPWIPSTWLVLLALVTLFILGSYLFHLYTQKQSPVARAAQRQLKQALHQLSHQPSAANLILVNHCLKRIALTIRSRKEVAHLHGHAWCAWLDTQGRCNHFTRGIGQHLAQPYNPDLTLSTDDARLLAKTLQSWLKTVQRRETKPFFLLTWTKLGLASVKTFIHWLRVQFKIQTKGRNNHG